MLELTTVSERRACRLAGLSRDTFRHPPEPTAATQALSARIIELAQVRRRFGYRRLHDLLRPEFPDVNHKKIYRCTTRRIWPYAGAGKPSGRRASVRRCRQRAGPTRYGAWTSSVMRSPMGVDSSA